MRSRIGEAVAHQVIDLSALGVLLAEIRMAYHVAERKPIVRTDDLRFVTGAPGGASTYRCVAAQQGGPVTRYRQRMFSMCTSAEPRHRLVGFGTRRAWVAVIVAFTTIGLAHIADASSSAVDATAALPVMFERNDGQWDSQAKYRARGAGFEVFFTQGAARIVRRDSRGFSSIQMRFVGARYGVAPIGHDPLTLRTNYLRGVSPSDTIVDVPSFSRVTYASAYPGIDVVYHGATGRLEYDFVVAPRSSTDKIRLAFDGADKLALSAEGHLVLGTRTGDIEFRRPVAYQDINGQHHVVSADYVLRPHGQVGFRVGRYDRRHRLVIDPVLSLSTNVWGNAAGVALDAARNIYVVGSIWTSGLPASNGYQTQLAGSQDAYVLKLNPSGTTIIYATYLGARRVRTEGLGIAVDAAGNAYVTGTTQSGYPITPGAYLASGTAFITKLNASGNRIVYSTYAPSAVSAMAIDGAGNVYTTGTASSLTTTAGAFQLTKSGASAPYVAKLGANGGSLAYATYVGGSGNDEGKGIAVDANGNAYVVGVARSLDFPTRNPVDATLSGATDVFVAKLNASGSALIYSTYLGGSGNERGFGIAVDALEQAYVTGWTKSSDFPVSITAFQRAIGYPDPAISNAFITKLNASGNSIVYSSYLGGMWCLAPGVYSCLGFFGPDEGIDAGTSIAVDATGYAYIGGYATSTLFPLVDSLQAIDPPNSDVWHAPFVAKVSPDGDRLVYATVVGKKVQDGAVRQLAVDSSGGVVAAGTATGELFPLTPGSVLGTGSAFVFRLEPASVPITMSASPNPVLAGQPVTFVATAPGAAAGSTIAFKDGAVQLGTSSLANGRATLTVTLSAGVHRMTATNTGDSAVSPPYFQLVPIQ